MPRIAMTADEKVSKLADLVLGKYLPEESAEALELESACIQGTSYRLKFSRATFHRRAENYPRWRIMTARMGGRLVGIMAAAIKEVTLLGTSTQAGFFFDLRVHPEFRGRGIAKYLAAELRDWAFARASFGYTYTMADNRVAAHLARVFGGIDASGYSYLIYPVYRRRPVRFPAERASFEEVHAAMLAVSSPFDFYANPNCQPGRGGYVASWLVRRGNDIAGCSAWSNRGILAEVVVSVPLSVRVAGQLVQAWPLRLMTWPHLPEPGEVLCSWYLFDFFATDGALARELMRTVGNEALAHDIGFCYLAHDQRDGWADDVRSEVPRIFAPIIPYRLLIKLSSGEAPRLNRLYVDVRDL